MDNQANDVQKILDTVPSLYRGPGGALAVVRNGKLVGEKTWGYANMDERVTVKPQTLMPICSISKHIVCMLFQDLERNPTPQIAANGSFDTQVENALRKLMPQESIWKSGLTMRNLVDMQSGLRDYWALSMILGAKPDQPFTIEGDGKSVMLKYKSFQFEPGMEFSYCNTNFYLLGRVIEEITKEPLAQLLAERIFRPANMTTAQLVPDLAQQPGGCLGYEGNEQDGYIPVTNRIEWAGDAGIVASLQDMIAYEKFFDQKWKEDDQYRSAASQVPFKDGSPSPYSFGLIHTKIEGVASVSHGGALRGWRLHRRYLPQESLSIVLLTNNEHAKVAKITDYVARKVLNLPESPKSEIKPATEWFGNFLDSETQLAITVSAGETGQIAVKYVREPENIKLVAPDRAETTDLKASISGDTLTIMRVLENRKLVAQRIKQESTDDGSQLQGKYHCAELDTNFVCEGQDNMLYGAFDGPLGRSPANLMRRLGDNVWAWACPRALDHTPPGDWTVVFKLGDDGQVVGCTVGCWLARLVDFTRT